LTISASIGASPFTVTVAVVGEPLACGVAIGRLTGDATVVAAAGALDDVAAVVVEDVELAAELLDEALLDEVALVAGVAVGDAPPQAVTSKPPAARPVSVRKRRRVNRAGGALP
jgi:hypothetical protein